MRRRSWIVLLGSAAALAAGLIGSVGGVAARAEAGGMGLEELGTCPERVLTDVGRRSGWAVAPVLDPQGSLVGWTLDGRTRGVTLPRIALPAESSVSADVGGRVVVTADDGRRSIVAIVSTVARCATIVAVSGDVARSGVLGGRDGSVLYHAVARDSRADLGIWVAVAGAPPQLLVDALPAHDPAVMHVGRVYATTLMLDEAGTRLAVQSCGAIDCRTRVVDLGTRREARLDWPGQGPLVAIAAEGATFADACGSSACATRTIALPARSISPAGEVSR